MSGTSPAAPHAEVLTVHVNGLALAFAALITTLEKQNPGFAQTARSELETMIGGFTPAPPAFEQTRAETFQFAREQFEI